MNSQAEMLRFTIPCDRCNGTGIYTGHTGTAEFPCTRCENTGRLTKKRLVNLRDNYFPKQHVSRGGNMSTEEVTHEQEKCKRQIADVERLLATAATVSAGQQGSSELRQRTIAKLTEIKSKLDAHFAPSNRTHRDVVKKISAEIAAVIRSLQ